MIVSYNVNSDCSIAWRAAESLGAQSYTFPSMLNSRLFPQHSSSCPSFCVSGGVWVSVILYVFVCITQYEIRNCCVICMWTNCMELLFGKVKQSLNARLGSRDKRAQQDVKSSVKTNRNLCTYKTIEYIPRYCTELVVQESFSASHLSLDPHIKTVNYPNSASLQSVQCVRSNQCRQLY